MSEDELQVEVARLRAENERLKGSQARVSLKVGAKGGVSLYGLGRFPVTLYKEQWMKLLDMAEEIRVFLQEHDSELKAKTPKET
jgi:50S ribosomal subunit-associated GTPase HflX